MALLENPSNHFSVYIIMAGEPTHKESITQALLIYIMLFIKN